MNKNKNLGFTLAEVLIVIGIIGVVAALTLPNLNHATGDKETVTRLQKAYSILNEANDRAVAIYGPVSTWKSNEQCADEFGSCYMKRIGEFLKISKSCDESGDSDSDSYVSCESLNQGDMSYDYMMYQLADGISFSFQGYNSDCDQAGGWLKLEDLCFTDIHIDINGPTKGKNSFYDDIFMFGLSDSVGIRPYSTFANTFEEAVSTCMQYRAGDVCAWWVLEYGNLDYRKADSTGKCNDSNIILNGTTNTSCH